MKSILALSMLLVAGFALPRSGRADPKPPAPVVGDPRHGEVLVRLNCASCHGTDGRGKGPLAGALPVHPGNLRDANLLLKRNDAELAKAITGGGAAIGKSPTMPAFKMDPLDVQDVIAYIREGQIQLTEFFGETTRYTSKTYLLDKERQKRIEPMTGPLSDAEREVTVVGLFKGQKVGDGPVYVPQDPRSLDTLRPENKLGYVSCLPVPLQPGEPTMTCFGLNERGVITAIRVAPMSVPDATRASLDALLAGFVGQGGKAGKEGVYQPLAPKRGTKATPAMAKALTRAYYRTLGAAAMFDRDELDRNPFD